MAVEIETIDDEMKKNKKKLGKPRTNSDLAHLPAIEPPFARSWEPTSSSTRAPAKIPTSDHGGGGVGEKEDRTTEISFWIDLGNSWLDPSRWWLHEVRT